MLVPLLPRTLTIRAQVILLTLDGRMAANGEPRKLCLDVLIDIGRADGVANGS